MKNWKAIVGVILVFVLGMIAGGLLVGGAVARRAHRVAMGLPMFTAEEVTHFLKRKLDLDAAQQQQVLVIVRNTQVQMKDARQVCEHQVWGVISNGVEQIQPILRPNQQEKLDLLIAERQAHRLP